MGRTRRTIACTLIVCLLASCLPLGAVAQEVAREPYRNPFLRAGQSLVIPGWGQWRNGDGNIAALWFVDSVIALMFATKFVSFGGTENSIRFWRTAGWIGYGLNATTSSYRAYQKAQSLNRENGYELDEFGAMLGERPDTLARFTLLSVDF
jgi:hypothetical protein